MSKQRSDKSADEPKDRRTGLRETQQRVIRELLKNPYRTGADLMRDLDFSADTVMSALRKDDYIRDAIVVTDKGRDTMIFAFILLYSVPVERQKYTLQHIQERLKAHVEEYFADRIIFGRFHPVLGSDIETIIDVHAEDLESLGQFVRSLLRSKLIRRSHTLITIPYSGRGFESVPILDLDGPDTPDEYGGIAGSKADAKEIEAVGPAPDQDGGIEP